MNAIEPNGISLASLVLRIAIGTNLLGHGLVRIGNKYGVFREWIGTLFSDTPIPSTLISTMGYIIPPMELVLGVLILVGWQTKLSLLLASLLMCSLIFGMCLLEKWEIVGIQMIYMVCYFLALYSVENQILSIDSFLKMRNL
ncbi:DoxX family protein [Leptospira meyeri]|uniref:MauE/DoxX family redox-associated membrane protein n=1 Tax=Leptospira meyeri TaxID=29508 RepID=UPI000C2ADB99|nr:MauE/DoxX family redox-associated membrane protein [Leptospira meyeri]PKA13773.1 DoxX family protein [Leptospira meyeri]TGM62218.1 DoxX family membrane protein [Leptospira meyeri]TGM71476.1 DoxX family membrane protein [Leptospira meyeri]